MKKPKELEAEHQAIVEEMKLAYEEVFSTVKGKKVLQDIVASGVIQRSAFNVDTHIMAANCAKQDFARHIVEMATPAEKPEQGKAIK